MTRRKKGDPKSGVIRGEFASVCITMKQMRRYDLTVFETFFNEHESAGGSEGFWNGVEEGTVWKVKF